MTRPSAYAVVALLVFFGLACEGQDMPETTMNPEAEEVAPNTLTAAEEADGWALLFDGASFDGWRGYSSDSIPGGWAVQDGAIYFTGDGGSGDIMTEEQYDNFELLIDWKISEAGNSGIMYHVTPGPETPWMTGPEVQILDNDGHPDAQNGLTRTAGANYDVHAPSQDVTNPVGEWNQLRLVINGPHVEHWMNGEKIVDYELWTDEWKEQVANSKWSEYPDYGLSETGHIALQDHGDPVWYRNIKIKRLG